MKIHRFIDNFDLSQKELEITGEIAKQMTLVLKLKIGEKVELCDGKGISVVAEIKKIDKKAIIAKITEAIKNKNINKKTILFCSILKKENFELVVQKTTECGIFKIIPIISERTIKTGLNKERLQKIAKEASEQSGRDTIPEISEPILFTKALELAKNDSNILFDASGEIISKDDSLNTNIWIGPEGGWTKNEIKKAKENNFSITSLGHMTLRGETAAIVTTYLITNI